MIDVRDRFDLFPVRRLDTIATTCPAYKYHCLQEDEQSEYPLLHQPCIAQPPLAQIEDMFKDGDTGNPKDAGDSNYVVSAGGSEHNPCCTYSYAINHPEQTRNPDIEDCSFPTDA